MKQKIDIVDSDVLVIGSGIAGLQAALTVAQTGKKPLLVSKSPMGKANNTTLAGGGFSFATEDLSVEAHIEKTLESGRFLNDRKLVSFFSKRAPAKFETLRKMGLSGNYHKRGFNCRSSALIGGPDLTALLVRACQAANVDFLENVMISDLAVSDRKCCGAVGFHKRTGDITAVRAKAVLLATGGAGAIYAQNDNAPGTTGDGYALCLEAGLDLLDMEFVQFYPLVYAGSGRSHLILPTSFGDLGNIVNRHGEDLKEKYGLHKKPIAVVSRDRLSQALYREVAQGNGVDNAILLDLRNADETQIPLDDHMIARYRTRLGYDKEPIKIMPSCHHTMGGVRIDEDGATGLAGLFAAGEVAGAIHGANRMGGNALSEGLVFGEAAGRSACLYAGSEKTDPGFSARAQDIVSRRFQPLINGDREPSDVMPIKKRLKKVLWDKVGIIRDHNALTQGISEIDEIRHELEGMRAGTPAALLRILECRNAVLTGKAVVLSALERTESRGAHFREDFPEEDENWRKHIQVRLSAGEIKISRIVSIKD